MPTGGATFMLPWQRLLPLLALALVAFCGQFGSAFYPVGDDVNMDFLSNDSRAKADMDRMMLMNSEDPKLRDEAHEAFKEIMKAKRLSKLQECRRTCVIDHEDAAEFRSCNERCEAANKPGVFGELPTLFGSPGQPPKEEQHQQQQRDDSKKQDEATAPTPEESKPPATDDKQQQQDKVEL